MLKGRIAVICLSLFAPLLLGTLLFSSFSASRTAHAAPTAAPVVDTLLDESDGSCADGDCSLRDAITATTTNEPITFIVNGTIDLSLGELLIDKDLAIDGGGVITVSGDNAVRVFNVMDGDVTFDGLTIANGKTQSNDCGPLTVKCGGGIILQNSGVSLTLTHSTIHSNSAYYGGGILSAGTLTVISSTLSDNVAASGAGLFNAGTVTLTHSTLSENVALNQGGGLYNLNDGHVITVNNSDLMDNRATLGGGIYIHQGVVTVTTSTLSGNRASDYGGGIYVEPDGSSTVNNSTLSANRSVRGGGIANGGDRVTIEGSTFSDNFSMHGGGIFNWGTLTMTNSTVSTNTATLYGGGIFNESKYVAVSNSTLSDNRAGTSGGGIASSGNADTFTTITGTIVSANVISSTTAPDDLALYSGATDSFRSGGYNLIKEIGDNINAINATGDLTDTLPSLEPLGDNGGYTLTHAPMPGSAAVDNGDCSSGPAADQRGVTRPQDDSCTIGAYEGSCAMIVMNDWSAGLESLRDRIAKVCDGGLITFDDGLANKTIDVSPDGQLVISKSVTISGSVPITVSGADKVRVFNVKSGDVTFDSLTIAHGTVQSEDCGSSSGKQCGSGIILQNDSVVVTVTHSTLISNSAADNGGAIYNDRGTLLVTHSTLSGNSAAVDGGGLVSIYAKTTIEDSILSDNSAVDDGGAISNHRSHVTITHSTLANNWSVDDGGGIYNYNGGVLTITHSTLSGNSAPDEGGAIYNSTGTVTLTHSTLSGNSAAYGGGILNYDTIVNIFNSTLTGNSADDSGGAISSYGDDITFTTLGNTIVSGNLNSSTDEADDLVLFDTDEEDSFISLGHNLVGVMQPGINAFTASGDMTDTMPVLAPLGDYGGGSLTHAALPGSPAVDAGGSCGEPDDQRGITRPQGSACDIGAFESRGFVFTLNGGSPQAAVVNTPFANPLALTVSSSYAEPVEGGNVTFMAPISGASVTFTETIIALGSGGAASLPVTANSSTGSYEVAADTAGNSGAALAFDLTNLLATYPVTVLKEGSGSGAVTSSPPGINCGAACSASFATLTDVTLTAVPGTDATFTGWDGACSGTAPCLLTIDGAKNVTAIFAVEEINPTIFLPVIIKAD